MGQRLVINIKNNGDILANAYYHWSAYSLSPLITALPIMEKLFEEKKEPTVECAIELLRLTGADITEDELKIAKKDYPFLKKVKDYDNRNEGLISISKKGIENSVYYGEGSIDLNLEDNTFGYSVLYEVTAEEYKEDYGKDLNEEELTHLDIDLDRIPIENLGELMLVVYNSYKTGDPFISGGKIHCIIS